MKFNYVFSGVELRHKPTIRKWLRQTFGNEASGMWQVSKYFKRGKLIPAGPFSRTSLYWHKECLQVEFKKEKHLALFLLKFGHL